MKSGLLLNSEISVPGFAGSFEHRPSTDCVKRETVPSLCVTQAVTLADADFTSAVP
jgi:hypothetical protein